MKNVCVVTGGGSGMCLAAAKLMAKTHKVIIVGRTVSKLENAIKEIKDLGLDAEAYPADMSDRESVKKLAEYAASQGVVNAVINGAGVSPAMVPDWAKLFDINAVGTIYVDEEFVKVMTEGGCILNVSSTSRFMLPDSMIPKQAYTLALTDADAFRAAIAKFMENVPEERRGGMAYPLSKTFVTWYTEHMAVKYTPKGIRVVSISPGVISTPLADSSPTSRKVAEATPIGREGKPEEIAAMMEFILRDTFLSGTDIVYDGGQIADMHVQAEAKAAEQA